MIKKTVKLKTLIERKLDLNKQIANLNANIKRNNYYKNKSQESNFALTDVESLKLKYQEDLISVKQAIARANTYKAKGENYSNDYYIYLRSELVREELHLIKMKSTILALIAKKIYEFFRISEEDISNKVKTIENKVKEIDEKLKKFNETQEITIEVNIDF